MNFKNAMKDDIDEITKLYQAAIGSPGCTWSMDYPNEEITQGDLERNALFCLKNDTGEIIGAISVDDDKVVEELSCWTADLQPGAELARLVVKAEYQNRGIARKLLIYAMQELAKRGYKSVHFLVSKTNDRALRSYAKLHFTNCGDVDLFGEHWWCYEKALSNYTPVLETDRLLLRPFCKEDAQQVFACWESDPDVAKYMFWCSHNDIEKTKEWIDFEVEQITSDKWFRWAVVDKKTRRLIGTGLVYFEPEYNLFEVGYNFGKKYWGQGYATETMQKIVDYARDVLGVKELIGRYAKDNSASGNVLKKLGFVYCKDIPYEANEGKKHYEGIECRLYL